MAARKRYLVLADIMKLTNLDAVGAAALVAGERLPVKRVGRRHVVPVRAWRKWVVRVTDRALANLSKRASAARRP